MAIQVPQRFACQVLLATNIRRQWHTQSSKRKTGAHKALHAWCADTHKTKQRTTIGTPRACKIVGNAISIHTWCLKNTSANGTYVAMEVAGTKTTSAYPVHT